MDTVALGVFDWLRLGVGVRLPTSEAVKVGEETGLKLPTSVAV